MSTRPISNLSPARLARLLAALPVAAAVACSDSAAPIAPQATPDANAGGTPPAALVNEFSNVQRQVLGDRISLYFQYTGVVTPSLTVGTSYDVHATQVRSAPATKQSGNYWSVTVAGLKASTHYHYRLDNLKSVWQDDVWTQRRQVVVDMDSIRIVSDGDWGWNCGEINNELKVSTVKQSILSPSAVAYDGTNEQCLHSGSTWKLPGASPFYHEQTVGSWHYASDSLWIITRAKDRDSCLGWEISCGPMALSYHAGVDVRKPGVTKIKLLTEREDGYSGQTRINAIWYLRVIVSWEDPHDYDFATP